MAHGFGITKWKNDGFVDFGCSLLSLSDTHNWQAKKIKMKGEIGVKLSANKHLTRKKIKTK